VPVLLTLSAKVNSPLLAMAEQAVITTWLYIYNPPTEASEPLKNKVRLAFDVLNGLSVAFSIAEVILGELLA